MLSKNLQRFIFNVYFLWTKSFIHVSIFVLLVFGIITNVYRIVLKQDTFASDVNWHAVYDKQNYFFW